jgi:hypothetical protein
MIELSKKPSCLSILNVSNIDDIPEEGPIQPIPVTKKIKLIPQYQLSEASLQNIYPTPCSCKPVSSNFFNTYKTEIETISDKQKKIIQNDENRIRDFVFINNEPCSKTIQMKLLELLNNPISNNETIDTLYPSSETLCDLTMSVLTQVSTAHFLTAIPEFLPSNVAYFNVINNPDTPNYYRNYTIEINEENIIINKTYGAQVIKNIETQHTIGHKCITFQTIVDSSLAKIIETNAFFDPKSLETESTMNSDTSLWSTIKTWVKTAFATLFNIDQEPLSNEQSMHQLYRNVTSSFKKVNYKTPANH